MTEPKQRPVTPREYLPVARDLLSRREEISAMLDAEREDEDVAGRDQADAAAREARDGVRRDMEALQRAGVDARLHPGIALNPRALAWALAVSGSISRRIPADRQCPHAAPGAQRVLVASLTSRWMTCRECAPRFAQPFALSGVENDDGLCDVCDRESVKFSEFQTTIGSLRLTGNICPLCRSWNERVQRDGQD